jgi:hypothetical protein
VFVQLDRPAHNVVTVLRGWAVAIAADDWQILEAIATFPLKSCCKRVIDSRGVER